ncbi:hypothetical protein SODALDRAFT_360545 [Sodiomyces alkalinus F11]|uniref:Uncharacterized protein n=1 Tax=Sodiomyces alkalinus (strain CBS 110278 / VKM F-3762 / F11) TaxID=1314773 RepID=A0A3N2PUM0_SODAK|nr:hypothetical protein SODALDRAFT_360545 [Sodiomyces alkalinus F11]ROT38203.1 hypothetical protein SODALDRAFT_360545 [Sodiomyces alkalinus F11]
MCISHDIISRHPPINGRPSHGTSEELPRVCLDLAWTILIFHFPHFRNTISGKTVQERGVAFVAVMPLSRSRLGLNVHHGISTSNPGRIYSHHSREVPRMDEDCMETVRASLAAATNAPTIPSRDPLWIRLALIISLFIPIIADLPTADSPSIPPGRAIHRVSCNITSWLARSPQHLDFVLSHRHLPPGPIRVRDRHTRGRNHGPRADLRDIRRILQNDRLSDPQRPLVDSETIFARHQMPRSAVRARRRLRGNRVDLDPEEDHVRLARSSIPLPGDHRRARVPSLERQDAFRDARTTKRAMKASSRSRQDFQDVPTNDLYRIGLLSSDNEHVHGAEFTLDAIVHDEPTYSITTRLGKRGKNNRKDDNMSTKLALEWDFAGLEEDEQLARYLVSSQQYGHGEDGSVVPRHGYRTIWRSPVQSTSASATAPSGDDDEPVPDLITDTDRATEDDQVFDDDDPEEDAELDCWTNEEGEPGWAVLSPTIIRDSVREDHDVEGAATEDASTGPWIVLGDGL